jgi:hypothetical protein
MPEKVALYAFNGDPMCFLHVLLNALDMEQRGYQVKIIIEGSATRTVNQLHSPGEQFHKLYQKVKEKGLIDCVCKACAAKMDALSGIEAQNLPVCAEMSGHPSIAKYIEQGYKIITF